MIWMKQKSSTKRTVRIKDRDQRSHIREHKSNKVFTIYKTVTYITETRKDRKQTHQK